MAVVLPWDWTKFHGSEPALKYARRDLETLVAVLKLVPGRTAVVQAGGSLGIFPKFLARSFQAVYCFEASIDLFPELCRNAPEPNILKYQAAVGDRPGMVGTSQTRRGSKAHRFPHEGITHVEGTGIVPTLKIDDLELPVCDLLVLDVEGFELRALLGASWTITRCQPVVMVEINDNITHYGATPDDVRAFLTQRDYTMKFRIHSDEVYVPRHEAAA